MQPRYSGRFRLLSVLFASAVAGCGGGGGSTSSDGGVAVDPAEPVSAPAPAPAPAGTYDTRVGLGADSTGVPLLTKHANAQYIYWNPTHANASDSNAGTDPNRPKATLTSAWSALRDGYGDWLLMANGSTYSEGFGQLSQRSGLSTQYPTVVTTYDVTDPTNTAKMRKGMVTIGTNPSTSTVLNIFGTSGSRMVFENMVFDKRNSSDAQVLMLGPVQRDMLFYNVRFLRTQVSIQGDYTDNPAQVKGVTFRRCVFAYGFSGSGHSQGLYMWNTDGTVVEDSIFYHNGWNGTNRDTATEAPDIFKHNAYFGTMTFNTVFRRNVSAAASSHGLQARGGGTIEDNVFANNPLNLLIGGGDNYTFYQPNGVPYSVKRNVVVGSDNITSASDMLRGYGVDMINTASGGVASDNLIVNSNTASPANYQWAFTPHTQLDAPTVVNWTNNIIWNWGSNSVAGAVTEMNRYPKLSLTMSSDVLPNDTPSGTNVKTPTTPFPDPTRTIATYASANGYASEQAFWDYMIQHPEANWAKILGDYIRAGFGK